MDQTGSSLYIYHEAMKSCPPIVPASTWLTTSSILSKLSLSFSREPHKDACIPRLEAEIRSLHYSHSNCHRSFLRNHFLFCIFEFYSLAGSLWFLWLLLIDQQKNIFRYAISSYGFPALTRKSVNLAILQIESHNNKYKIEMYSSIAMI